MFDGFLSRMVDVDRGTIYARVGGDGPPVLLLHGYPQTHVMWHAVVGHLTAERTVVVVDLPGYGQSFRPGPSGDHDGPHAVRRGLHGGALYRRSPLTEPAGACRH